MIVTPDLPYRVMEALGRAGVEAEEGYWIDALDPRAGERTLGRAVGDVTYVPSGDLISVQRQAHGRTEWAWVLHDGKPDIWHPLDLPPAAVEWN
jgi:hypothetical protein